MKGELSESDNQVLVSLEEGSRLPSITDRRAILSCRIEWKFLDAFHGWLMDMCRTCSCWLSTDNARSTGKSLLLAWWIEQNGKEREVKESSNGGVGSWQCVQTRLVTPTSDTVPYPYKNPYTASTNRRSGCLATSTNQPILCFTVLSRGVTQPIKMWHD